ncbi:hypothetical protein GCM10010525_19930 [Glutamicibacter bergerei]|uniref:Uncharacterized protein n=1 Tax=Glutamicibacter ardleyensis TaxID=225894 RepID=A0ABQ2DBF4_9MICC|nr:hypothetical protein GCM10007173_04070 [Glutamicibacter ardleyensis]
MSEHRFAAVAGAAARGNRGTTMDGAEQMSSNADRILDVEHSAWQGWIEIQDETELLAAS